MGDEFLERLPFDQFFRAHKQDEGAFRSLQHGIEAVHADVAVGRKFSKGASVIRTPEGRGTAALTEREREIALLAKQQFSTKEIAGQLMVSTATVKNTLNKVYAKLNVRRKSDLIQLTF